MKLKREVSEINLQLFLGDIEYATKKLKEKSSSKFQANFSAEFWASYIEEKTNKFRDQNAIRKAKLVSP